MNAYKKDFEKAIEMIDWQTEMLKKQADRIAELEKELTLVNAKLQFMFEQEIKSARINR